MDRFGLKPLKMGQATDHYGPFAAGRWVGTVSPEIRVRNRSITIEAEIDLCARKITSKVWSNRNSDMLACKHRLPALNLSHHDIVGRMDQFGNFAIVERAGWRLRKQINPARDGIKLG